MVPIFEGVTANEVWRAAAARLTSAGDSQASRAGKTRELLHAVFAIRDPRQRWVSARQPAINPAFAIAETLWLILGRDDAAFPNYWNPMLPKFSGRTAVYRGAYGRRLRRTWGLDQLRRAAQALESAPDSRQIVLQIWHPGEDLPKADGSPRRGDIPCNICSLLKVRHGRLEWTQVLRSNDLFLGVPYNFVQFTTLQEVMAGWLGVGLGQYTHLSDSLHAYQRDLRALSAPSAATTASNDDSLSLQWKESREVLGSLWRKAAPLTLDSLTPAKFRRLLAGRDLPTSYENLLRVMAADSARRRRWTEEMGAASVDCRNPSLRQVWEAWCERRTVSALTPSHGSRVRSTRCVEWPLLGKSGY